MEDSDLNTYVEMTTVDDRIFMIHARHRGFIKEWTWRFDMRLGDVVRSDHDGRTVPLFEDLARLMSHGKIESRPPEIQKTTLRVLFGHLPEYREMIRLTSSQDRQLFDAGEITAPSMHSVMGDLLFTGLYDYFSVLAIGGRTVEFDRFGSGWPEGFLDTPKTLADFWGSIATGNMVPARAPAVGTVPEIYGRQLIKRVGCIWFDSLVEHNVIAKEARSTARDIGIKTLHLREYAVAAIALVGTYPLPMPHSSL